MPLFNVDIYINTNFLAALFFGFQQSQCFCGWFGSRELELQQRYRACCQLTALWAILFVSWRTCLENNRNGLITLSNSKLKSRKQSVVSVYTKFNVKKTFVLIFLLLYWTFYTQEGGSIFKALVLFEVEGFFQNQDFWHVAEFICIVHFFYSFIWSATFPEAVLSCAAWLLE